MSLKNKNKIILSDKEWALVKDLATLPVKNKRKTLDPRYVLSACLCVFENDIPWSRISDIFYMSPTTAKGYYKKLRQRRRWNAINNILEDYRSQQGRRLYKTFRTVRQATALSLIVLLSALPVSPIFAQDDGDGTSEVESQDGSTTTSDIILIADIDQKLNSIEQEEISQIVEGEAGEVSVEESKNLATEPSEDSEFKVIEKELTKDQETIEENNKETTSSDSTVDLVEEANQKAAETETMVEDEIANELINEQVGIDSEEDKAVEEAKPETKTVYAIKEVIKTIEVEKETSTDNDQPENTGINENNEDQNTDEGIVLGESIENTTPEQDQAEEVIEEDKTEAEIVEEQTEEKILHDLDELEVPEVNSTDNSEEEKPIDEESLREQLKRELMAEIRQNCLEFEDGSYYCADEAVDVSEEDHTERWLNLFSSRQDGDLEFDEEIYFEQEGKQVRLTDKKTRDLFLAQDVAGRSAVWQSLVEGRWQIFYYDKKAEEPKQLTSGNYNNMHPQIYDDTVVWQAWVDGDWDIFLAERQSIRLPNTSEDGTDFEDSITEGWVLRQITDNDLPDLFPKIAAGVVTWQGNRGGSWQVFAYDLNSRTVSQLSDGQGNYENPRFNIVWDDREESGEVMTVGYDLGSGELKNLSDTKGSDKNNDSSGEKPLEEEAIMVSRTEGSQNQQNKNKNENKKTQN